MGKPGERKRRVSADNRQGNRIKRRWAEKGGGAGEVENPDNRGFSFFLSTGLRRSAESETDI